MAIVGYFLFLAAFAITVTLPVVAIAVVIGWVIGHVAGNRNSVTAAWLSTVVLLWFEMFVWAFFVDGTGQVVFLIFMTGVWTVPVALFARALSERSARRRSTRLGGHA